MPIGRRLQSAASVRINYRPRPTIVRGHAGAEVRCDAMQCNASPRLQPVVWGMMHRGCTRCTRAAPDIFSALIDPRRALFKRVPRVPRPENLRGWTVSRSVSRKNVVTSARADWSSPGPLVRRSASRRRLLETETIVSAPSSGTLDLQDRRTRYGTRITGIRR